MKHLIILMLLFLGSFVCQANEFELCLEDETSCELAFEDYVSCELAFEDTEILYGSLVIHMLTTSVDFYYCTYDTATLIAEVYSSSINHYAGANSKLWTLKETFGVPTGGGDNYECFLQEITGRGISLP